MEFLPFFARNIGLYDCCLLPTAVCLLLTGWCNRQHAAL